MRTLAHIKLPRVVLMGPRQTHPTARATPRLPGASRHHRCLIIADVFSQPRWRWFRWTLSPAQLTQIFNGRIHYHWPDHQISPNREHLRGRIQSGLCQTSEFTAASSQSLWATVTLTQWPCKRNISSRTVEFQSCTALLTFDTMGVFQKLDWNHSKQQNWTDYWTLWPLIYA